MQLIRSSVYAAPPMTRQKPARKNRRWPGVKPAARELGISYEHLLMCIKGIRQSKRLMCRYRKLRGSKQARGRQRHQTE